MPTLPYERTQQRLEVVNKVVLPFLKSADRQRKLLRLLGKNTNPVTVLSNSDYTVNILVYTLPLGNPLVIALYASTQTSRPISPGQLARKLRRLREATTRLHGKLFTQADIVYLLYAPAGLTRGAARTAIANGVSIARSVKDLLHSLARYIKTRYQKLAAKIRGKRIWGRLPLLLYMLAHIASHLGATVEKPPLDKVVEAATKGAIIT